MGARRKNPLLMSCRWRVTRRQAGVVASGWASLRHAASRWLRGAVGVLLFAALAGCAAGIGASSDRSSEDARLTAEVKVALVRAPALGAAAIDVQARAGTVRLSGFVETADQKARARSIAQSVAGVIAVEDAVEVK